MQDHSDRRFYFRNFLLKLNNFSPTDLAKYYLKQFFIEHVLITISSTGCVSTDPFEHLKTMSPAELHHRWVIRFVGGSVGRLVDQSLPSHRRVGADSFESWEVKTNKQTIACNEKVACSIAPPTTTTTTTMMSSRCCWLAKVAVWARATCLTSKRYNFPAGKASALSCGIGTTLGSCCSLSHEH